jgi:serine/threonine protein kinase
MKPENLLLKTKPKNLSGGGSNTRNGGGGNNLPIDVKIIDFGLSKLMEPNDTLAHTFLGTRGYLAPEMLQRREYTRAVDAWAMGVIVFVLLCGCLPFDDDSAAVPHDDLLLQSRFVLRFPRWAKNLSASAKDLLNHLLDINPRTRYTAEQALNHPWVRGDTAPRSNLLASPGRIRKSPAPGNAASYAGRKFAPPPMRTPPTPQAPRVRKGSF